jgi:hypothetical protein
MDELDRLGRPGAYRLGAAGAGPDRPRPCRPSFARARRRGPVSAWVLAFAAGAAAVAAGAVVGLFFTAFIIGLVTGLVARWGGWRLRVTLPAAAVMAVLGWGFALAWQAWHAEPHGARGTIAVLLAGVLQALAGVWLGRALAARRARRTTVRLSDARTDREDETRDLVRLLGVRERTGPAATRHHDTLSGQLRVQDSLALVDLVGGERLLHAIMEGWQIPC